MFVYVKRFLHKTMILENCLYVDFSYVVLCVRKHCLRIYFFNGKSISRSRCNLTFEYVRDLVRKGFSTLDDGRTGGGYGPPLNPLPIASAFGDTDGEFFGQNCFLPRNFSAVVFFFVGESGERSSPPQFKSFQKICPEGKFFEMVSWGCLGGRSPPQEIRLTSDVRRPSVIRRGANTKTREYHNFDPPLVFHLHTVSSGSRTMEHL